MQPFQIFTHEDGTREAGQLFLEWMKKGIGIFMQSAVSIKILY